MLDQKARLMIVDESESFEISIRVQGLIGALKGRTDVEVTAKTFDPDEPMKTR